MIVWGHIAKTLESGDACALVTVASAKGSTPRETGARMTVRADGGYYGTIGGGTLEFEAIRWAKRALSDGHQGLDLRTVSLGPDLGQCCGGRVDVAIEVISADQIDDIRTLAALEADGEVFSTEALVLPNRPLRRQITAADKPDAFALAGDGTLTETFGETRRPLFLFGAGHVGRAVVLALAPLPFQVTWIDSRPDAFPAAAPANTWKRRADRPAEILGAAPDGAFVLVMTHSHALDEDIIAAALAQQRFDYCGVIGSATKRARFQKRLKMRGLGDGLVQSMVCPVGLPAIRSKHPAAIAAGIAADLAQKNEAVRRHELAIGGVAVGRALGQ